MPKTVLVLPSQSRHFLHSRTSASRDAQRGLHNSSADESTCNHSVGKDFNFKKKGVKIPLLDKINSYLPLCCSQRITYPKKCPCFDNLEFLVLVCNNYTRFITIYSEMAALDRDTMEYPESACHIRHRGGIPHTLLQIHGKFSCD